MPERKEFSYSIWLMPEGKDYQRLAAITNRLSKEYKSPQIRPHVTLVGGFVGDVEKFLYLAEGLARDISPINVELGAIGTFDEFFRSVFLRAKKSNGLMVAYETVSNMIPDIDPHFSPNSQTYLPHLSLIYGNFDRTFRRINSKL